MRPQITNTGLDVNFNAGTALCFPGSQNSSILFKLQVSALEKGREDRSRDNSIPLVLPMRPTSKARPPSAVRTRKITQSRFNQSNDQVPRDVQAEIPPVDVQGICMNKQSENMTNVDQFEGDPLADGSDNGAVEVNAERNKGSKVASKPLFVVIPNIDSDMAGGALKDKQGFNRRNNRSLVESPYKKSAGTFFHLWPENDRLNSRRNVTVMASVAFPGMKEQYERLRLSPGASEKDVKRAYRRLALRYHPDVCKGDVRGVQFHKINQAYETLMSSLAKAKQQSYSADYSVEGMMGINNAYWDEWEEWMGWEGAGTLDYSSHINIYA